MLRRLPALFSVFVLSALLTRAGLAGASEEPANAGPVQRSDSARALLALELDAPDVQVEPLVEPTIVLASGAATRTIEPSIALDPDPDPERALWKARIAARLDALARVRTHEAAHAIDPILEREIQALARRLGPSAEVAVEVRDLERDAILVDLASQRPHNPASTHKLVTATAAAELLGPDYRFTTRVLRRGDALFLRGEGDPTLHAAELRTLAEQVVARGQHLGVRRIIVDDSVFTPDSFGPGFHPQGPGESYEAPSGALSVEWSTLVVTARPGRSGEPVSVSVEPQSPFVTIEASATTGDGWLHIDTVAGEDGRTIVQVRGALPAGRGSVNLRRRVYDPGLFTGGVFALQLAELSEADALPVERGEAPHDAEPVALHHSAPLVDALGSAMRWSNNFTAENTLRTLAWRATGEPGSWAAGVELLERFIAAVSPSEAERAHVVNGSGLSLEGRLTARLLGDVLALGERPGSGAEALRSILAEAGGEGTLHHRVPSAGARLQAKTGTYADACTLTGLVHDARGERTLAFTVLVQGGSVAAARSMQDRVAMLLLRSR